MMEISRNGHRKLFEKLCTQIVFESKKFAEKVRVKQVVEKMYGNAIL